jgi:hypothetical protein
MPKISSGADAGLRALRAEAIVRAVAGAAERWCDADFPPRVRATAAIAHRLGYTIPVVDYALDRLFGGISTDTLTAAIVDELGSLAALDGFTEHAGRPASWARAAGAVTIVSSDTTIGVAIAPLVFALCAKCTVTVKDRSDDLVAAFVETLGEEEPALAAATTVRSWAGGDDGVEARALGDAAVVVAFGGDDALREIRRRCAPGATLVAFGHRTSAGYVASGDLAGERAALALAIARDALLYDGDGCLSLHLLFVERTAEGAHERFVEDLAAACAATAIEFPAGPRKAARAARANAYAATAAFRAANGTGRVLRAPDGAWSVVADPPPDDLPPFGGGVLPVLFVDGIAGSAAYVRRHALPVQAVGVADPGSAAAAELADALGAVRIARFGTMQDPPLAGRHGGRARIADFVRWVDRA